MPIAKPAARAALLLAMAAPAIAQTQAPTPAPAPDINLQIRNLRGNVYMIDDVKGANSDAGGNVTALVGDDGVVLGDSMMAVAAPEIPTVLQTVTRQPVRFVFATHWHPDHRGGFPFFGPTAALIAHPNAHARMSATNPETNAPVAPETGWPDLLVPDSLTLRQNGETVELRHYPRAHTSTDLVAFFRNANVVQMGDNYFSGMFQFVADDGSTAGVVALMEDVLARTDADTLIVPGHGPLSKRADLEASLAMLKATRAIAADGIARGLTVQQLLADGTVAARFERWSHGYVTTEQYFQYLYEDLARG